MPPLYPPFAETRSQDNMADAPQTEVDAPGHPTAGVFLVAFKGCAMTYYILCGWFPVTFVLNFCIVMFLLVCDFWTVSCVRPACLVARCGAVLAPPAS